MSEQNAEATYGKGHEAQNVDSVCNATGVFVPGFPSGLVRHSAQAMRLSTAQNFGKSLLLVVDVVVSGLLAIG